jgi:hypothetical protein
MPRVIGITGLAGAGKSSAASLLMIHHGFRLVKFADPLKDMLRSIGLGIDEIEGHKKGLPCRLLGGRSPRYAIQTLGTDWGRSLISDSLWTNIFRARAKVLLLDGSPVVCDDVRFENEVDVIRDLGGEIWNIRRNVAGRIGATGGLPGHESESGVAARRADRTINNNGTLDELLLQVSTSMSFP